MKTRVTYLVCARLIGAVVLLVVPAALTAQATQSDEGAYGFVRVVDGSAYLVEAGTGQRTDVQANEPLLTGDHLFVAARSRVELLLSDNNIARLGDRAELELVSLAGSPDGQADHTVLRLRRGTLQLVVSDDFVGGFYPTLETPYARIEVRASGSYLVTTDGSNTVLTVRRGAADVLTDRGSDRADAGDELIVDGSGRRDVRYTRAGSLHSLERWGDDLAAAAYGQDVGYVDANLAYAAAPLARYGRWVTVGGRNAWYPHNRSGWRPYWNGHWRHTPTGLFWVSYEPWGWVPYHYGVWDDVPGYGWLWFPGRRFAPAWVAWYWGPAYVGWAPLGYYAGYYSSGFRISIGFGHYGWGYGPAQRFRGFTFVPGHKFGRRHQHKWARRGYDLGRSGHVFRRGIITSDTRSITPPRWRRPGDVVRGLDEDGRRRRGGRSLPDATPFSGRVRDLPRNGTQVALGNPGRDGGARDRPGGGARDRAGGSRDRAGGARDRAGGARDRVGDSRGRAGTRRQSAANAPNRRPIVSSPTRRQPQVSAPGRRRASADGPNRRTPEGRSAGRSRGPEPRSRQPVARTPTRTPERATPRAGSGRSADRPSRAGPGAERGRVKVHEPRSRRSGPETRSRRSPTVTRPIATGDRGRSSRSGSSSARRSRGSNRSSVSRSSGYERSSPSRVPGYSRSSGRASGLGRSSSLGRSSGSGRSSPRAGAYGRRR